MGIISRALVPGNQLNIYSQCKCNLEFMEQDGEDDDDDVYYGESVERWYDKLCTIRIEFESVSNDDKLKVVERRPKPILIKGRTKSKLYKLITNIIS